MPTVKGNEHRFCVATKTGGSLPKGFCTPVTPRNNRKDENFMREREKAINIRVTESEKRKMEKAAKLCELSLSAYLRKVALGKEIRAIAPQSFYEAYRQLKVLKAGWKSSSEATVDRAFELLEQSILNAYHELESNENGSKQPWQ